jgi:hypothetical protein
MRYCAHAFIVSMAEQAGRIVARVKGREAAPKALALEASREPAGQ